jgi:hypothetical protein
MKIVLAAALAAFACASASEASAVGMPSCAKHEQMVGILSQLYSEKPIAMGTVNEDRFMQLFVSRKGSWTILMTKTDGQACIVAAGKNWENLPGLASIEPAA